MHNRTHRSKYHLRLRSIAVPACSLLAVLWLAGCSSNEQFAATEQSASAGASAGGAPSAAQENQSPSTAPAAAGAGVMARQVSTASRKIIYTAEISLIVDNLSESQQKLAALVARHKGYIAGTNIGGNAGDPRQGTWKIRVPVDNYDAFMSGAVRLGEVQTVHSDSKDVSDEYFDLEARLSNKRVEEKRLLAHLQKSTAKLEDILTVEKEISRVREEIERMEGRLRVLANQTSLTTITVTIKEVKDYVPPAPPTFATQISRTFSGSLKGIVELGKSITLSVVALAPWLVVLLIIGLPVWILARRSPGPKHTSMPRPDQND